MVYECVVWLVIQNVEKYDVYVALCIKYLELILFEFGCGFFAHLSVEVDVGSHPWLLYEYDASVYLL